MMTMDVSITHSLVADGDPLVDDGDWNDDHTLSTDLQTLLTLLESMHTAFSGKTIKIPVLIETKTCDDTTDTYTFSGLQGNTDGEYLVEARVKVATGSNSTIGLRFNNDTGNNYTLRQHYTNTTNVVVENSSGQSYIRVTLALGDNVSEHTFSLKCSVQNGFYRRVNGWADASVGLGTGRYNPFINSGWSGTAEVTSITIACVSGRNFTSGTIRLYKMVEVTL